MYKETKEKMLRNLHYIFDSSGTDKPDTACLAAIAICMVEKMPTEADAEKAAEILSKLITNDYGKHFERVGSDMPILEI